MGNMPRFHFWIIQSHNAFFTIDKRTKQIGFRVFSVANWLSSFLFQNLFNAYFFTKKKIQTIYIDLGIFMFERIIIKAMISFFIAG